MSGEAAGNEGASPSKEKKKDCDANPAPLVFTVDLRNCTLSLGARDFEERKTTARCLTLDKKLDWVHFAQTLLLFYFLFLFLFFF